MAVLVTGGARSGKSRFAESYAVRLASRGIYVATAQPFDDEMEIRIRSHRKAREQSGFLWETIEEPLDLAGVLDRIGSGQTNDAYGRPEAFDSNPDAADAQSVVRAVHQDVASMHAAGAAPIRTAASGSPVGRPVVLVDCLTLWLTNHLLAVSPDGNADSARIEREMDRRVAALADAISRFPHPLVLVTNEVGAGIVPETPLGRLFRDVAGRMNQRLAGICDRVFLVVSGIPVELKSIAYRMENLDGRPS